MAHICTPDSVVLRMTSTTNIWHESDSISVRSTNLLGQENTHCVSLAAAAGRHANLTGSCPSSSAWVSITLTAPHGRPGLLVTVTWYCEAGFCVYTRVLNLPFWAARSRQLLTLPSCTSRRVVRRRRLVEKISLSNVTNSEIKAWHTMLMIVLFVTFTHSND